MKKVTLIMPVRNGEKYLGEMLESIFKQTYLNIELLVAYDQSTDGTLDILKKWKMIFQEKKYDLKIIENKVLGGITAAINTAIPYISGDYIMFPDADDYVYETYVEDMVNALEDNPDFGWACCDAVRIKEYENKEDNVGYKKCINPIYKDIEFPLHALLDLEWRAPWNIMVRRDFFARAFPNNKIFPHPTSHELAIRLPLLFNGEFCYVNKKLYKYILHDTGFVNKAMNNLMGSIRYLDSMQVCGEDVISALNLSANMRNKYVIANRIYYLSEKARVADIYSAEDLRNHYIELTYDNVCDFKDVSKDEGFDPVIYFDWFVECAAGIAVDLVLVKETELNIFKKIEGQKFIIYGAGKNGRAYVRALSNLGYRPEEIWDSYANDEEICGIQVRRPHKGFEKDIPILLSIGNAGLWPEIMDGLRMLDYCNIFSSSYVSKIIRTEMLKKYFKESIRIIY